MTEKDWSGIVKPPHTTAEAYRRVAERYADCAFRELDSIAILDDEAKWAPPGRADVLRQIRGLRNGFAAQMLCVARLYYELADIIEAEGKADE